MEWLSGMVEVVGGGWAGVRGEEEVEGEGWGVGKRISGAEKETATNMVGKKRRGRQVEREVEDR